MSSIDKENMVLELKYIGEDYWSRPVYQDQYGHLWKDIELGDNDNPSLYSSTNDDFDGEPDTPIRRQFVIVQKPPDRKKQFQYMMLGRWKSDCDYYLGYGNRNPGRLCADTPQEHIEAMKKLWLSFAEDEKPEWLTWEQILEYEKQMCGGTEPAV